jgi:hypothetical protein
MQAASSPTTPVPGQCFIQTVAKKKNVGSGMLLGKTKDEFIRIGTDN